MQEKKSVSPLSEFEMTENQRLKIFRESLNLKQGAFAKTLGMKQGSYSEIERGTRNTTITSAVLKKLIEKFKVNPLWLYTGIGEMQIPENSNSATFKSVPKSIPKSIPNSENNGIPASLALNQPALVTVDEHGQDNIVMVDVKAAAGYPFKLLEPSFFKKLPAFKLPGVAFKNGLFRAFQIDGDSMFDTLDHGDWVICRHLDRLEDINEGYIHVIVTQEEISVKRLLNRVVERGKLVLISDNEDYPTRELEASDVREIWIVKARIGFQLRARRRDLFRVINNLHADMVEVKSRIKKLEHKSPSKGT